MESNQISVINKKQNDKNGSNKKIIKETGIGKYIILDTNQKI